MEKETIVDDTWVKHEVKRRIKKEVKKYVKKYFQEHSLDEIVQQNLKPGAFIRFYDGDDGK